MRDWEIQLSLDRGDPSPVFLQIARAITEDVRRGRLLPGAALPGSRSLATTLAVHRNTVLAAYQELAAEGWIVMEPQRGTFVSRDLPDPKPRRFAPEVRQTLPAHAGFDLPPLPEPSWPAPLLAKGTLSLAGGLADMRLAPTAALARAYRRALKPGRQARALLDYGDAQGHPRLRAALSHMLAATRRVAATPETLAVTRGSQQAVYLIARALLRPGDVVAVEALGYRPAWEAFKQAGARLVPVPIDGAGLDVDALAALAKKERLRAVYVTPHHQYPTTATLAPGRRLALLALARAERMMIVEDDYDHEFHYDGRPILPLASADPAGVVIYIGTLSKILAPGLRIGYIVAPRPVIERVTAHRVFLDRQGDQTVEHAVASLVEDGELQRHVRRVRRIYQARRDVLVDLLRTHLAAELAFETPSGGIALWAHVAPQIDVEAWVDRALAGGVAFHPARRFAFDGRARPAVRLGYAASNETELREAVRRMKAALPLLAKK